MLRVFWKDRLCFILLFLIHISLSAQYSKDAFYHYTVKDGLPSMNCYDILQDHSGFIWIATEGGLSKFNGKSFKNYTVKDGLPTNEVVNVLLDSKNRIWLNASGPLSYSQSDKIRQIETEVSSLLSWSFGIAETTSNDLWINESNVIKRFEIETLEPLPIHIDLPGTNEALKIIGSKDESVYFVNTDTLYQVKWDKIISSFPLPRESKTSSFNLRFYHLDLPNLLYADSEGLKSINIHSSEKRTILSTDSYIEQILITDRCIWVKTQDSIICVPRDENENLQQPNTFLENVKVAHMHIDKNQNLWVATEEDGLYLFPYISEEIQNIDLSEHCSNNIRAIHIEDNGDLYLGTTNSEVVKISGGKTSKVPFDIIRKNDANRILDIQRLDKEYLIGSADNGIVLFNDDTSRQIIRTSSKRIHKRKDSILINTYNCLIGTSVSKLRNMDFLAIGQETLRKNIFTIYNPYRCYSSIRDSKNRLWIGDAVRGLIRVDGLDTLQFQSVSDLFKVGIVKIIELDDGTICLATNGRGLILIKDELFYRIDKSNGLSSSICYDVESQGNKIFVGTNKGVNVITRTEKPSDFSITTYGTLDGLISDDIYVVNAFKDTLYLGTNKGLSKINHQYSSKDSLQDYNINIDKIFINGFERTLDELTHLSLSENNILIQFESPAYGNEATREYQYKLDAIDKDWIFTRSNDAHYSSLNSGKYTFEVGLKSDIIDDPAISLQSIDIHIRAKWYQTWWTRLVLILGLISLFILPVFYWISQNQRLGLSRLVDQRTEQLDSKMRELSEMNRQLSLSNQELEQFAFIASHDLQEPLNTLIGFSSVLNDKWKNKSFDDSEKILSIIGESSRRMKDLIHDMLEFSRIGTHGEKNMINCQELIDEVVADLSSSIQKKNALIEYSSLPKMKAYATEFRSLIQNLLSNALKFQNPNSRPIIRIESSEDANYHHFKIADNGIGIPRDGLSKVFQIFQRMHTREQYNGTGIGLAQCKKIVDLHNGDIWIVSKINVGTTVHFRIAKT